MFSEDLRIRNHTQDYKNYGVVGIKISRDSYYMYSGEEIIYDRTIIIADMLKPHNEQIITINYKRGVVYQYNRKEHSRDCFTLNTEDIVIINIHNSSLYDNIAYYTERKVIVCNFNKNGTTGVVNLVLELL